MLVKIFSATGRWDIPAYDSSYLCINHNQTISTGSGEIMQRGYFLADGYELIVNDDLENPEITIGDTIFQKCYSQHAALILYTGTRMDG